MASLFQLFGEIFIENDKANKSLDETTGKAEKTSSKFGTVAKGIGVAGAAIAGAAIAGGTAIVGLATNTAKSADEIDKMSQRLGMSRESYQEWSYVLSQNGVDINSFQSGMKSLVTNMDKANEGNKTAQENFQKLGISIYDSTGALKDQDTMLNEAVKAFQTMPEGTEKSRLAMEVFGKQGQEILPMLNGTKGSIDELKQAAHDYGMIMSDDAVSAGVKLTDNLDTLKRSLGGAANQLGAAVMPAVNTVVKLIIDNMPKIQSMIGKLAPVFAEAADALLPPLMDLASELLPVVLDTISSLMPFISDVASKVLPVIADLFAKFLPPLAQIAEKLLPVILDILTPFLDLLGPLFDILDPIIDLALLILDPLISLIDLILPPLADLIKLLIEEGLKKLQEGLTIVSDVLGQVFGAAFEAMTPIIEAFQGLIEGISTFISDIFAGNWDKAWSGIQNTFSNFSTSIKNGVNDFINSITGWLNDRFPGVGDIITGVFDNVKNTVSAVIDSIKGIIEGIVTFVTGVFSGDWEKAWEGIKSIFKNVVDGLTAVFKMPINNMIDLINGFINGIRNMKIPDWVPGVGGKSINLPNIPKLNIGMEYVPYDDFPALLHRGERVLTAGEAEAYKAPQQITVQTNEIDYEKLARVLAMVLDGLGIKLNDREFGRLIAKLS